MKKWLFLLIFIVLIPLTGEAQCAMCKAVAETGQQAGSSVGAGLNTGILYLMAFPYILMSVIGYAIYRHKKLRS